jgi:signal transduction histidine kinase
VAQEALLAKRHLFKAMDHEFRTPISLISGFSELLIDDVERGASKALHLAHLEDIRSAAHHLLMMVEDAGRYLGLGSAADLRRQPVLLSRVIEGAVHRIAHVLQGGTANLHVAVEGQVEVDADLPMLQQALANLIAEVVRRAAPQDRIGVAAVEIRCSTLILPESMFRGHGRNATGAKILNRGLEGSGVSLFVAERIIRFHGGELSIRSREGVGTTIRVALPRAAAHAVEQKGAA